MAISISSKNQGSHQQEAELTSGEVLRRARRERGIEIAEVCQELGLTKSSLEALETNNFEQLPSGVYVRGYIRRYCGLLKIDADAVVSCYEKLSGETNATDERRTRATAEAFVEEDSRSVERRLAQKKTLPFLLMAIVIALLLLWMIQPSNGNEVEITDKVTVSDVEDEMKLVAEPLLVTAAVEEAHEIVENINTLPSLSIHLLKESWVEIVDANGDILLADLKRGDSELTLTGVAPFEVLLGNAVGAKISYLGTPVVLPVNSQNNTVRLVVDP